METVVGVEENDEAKFEEKSSSSSQSQSPKQIADPVVYKLVRVQGDGRLVPATEDEVMEVEDMLEDDKTEIHVIEDTGQTLGCNSEDGPVSRELLIEGSEGFLQSENAKVDADKLNARLEYIEEMLQKVKQEERLRIACGSPDHTSAYMNIDSQCTDQRDKLTGIDEKLQSKIHLQEIVSSSPPGLADSHVNQTESVVECSKPQDESVESVSSASAVCTTASKPDFSKLNGEICLDNLSIRELHETFKATFGRDTTVKDKQWLKRRIAMGWTNSCDVSTTTFVIKNNKLLKKDIEEICESVEGTSSKEENGKSVDLTKKDPVVGPMNDTYTDSPIFPKSGMEDYPIVSCERLGNTCEDHDLRDEVQTEHRAAKRVRKPTRRYIEELEVESREYNVKLPSTVKNSGHGEPSPRSCVRPVRNVTSDGRAVVTRMDSLGGSGVQVPFVSRVRRSRPRKNVMSLMRFHPSGIGIGMAAKLVKKALGVRSTSQPNNRSENEILKARSFQKVQQPLVTAPGKDMQCPIGMVEMEQKVDQRHIDSSGDASDDNVVTVPTPKGGMRRKHHRAWSLSEVMKLVEGVSRYGAGRWSEIKRLAFASYSYRTSVDLKDKWRNLLRASFAQTPSDNGMNSRKHGSTPIPAPILLRVRELAEMHAQIPPSKMVSIGGRNVHETTRAGFL